MASLHFFYGPMNSGKSTALQQAAYNYQERHMKVLLFASHHNDRDGIGTIRSRIGLNSAAFIFHESYDFFTQVTNEHDMQKISCIFIDEAQFLTQDQVWNLTEIVDRLGIPVMCYGLRTDFQGNLFSGSAALFALADHIIEHKCICNCGHKAIMNGRLNALGEVIRTGEQMLIGGNDLYQSFCRKDYKNLSQKKI